MRDASPCSFRAAAAAPSACRRCSTARSPPRPARPDRRAGPSSSIRQPSGVQGTNPSSPVASRPALTGWKPSTSLSGSIRVITPRSSICGGQRQLDEDAVDRRIGVERSTSASRSSCVVSAGSRCSKLAIPASTRRLALGADIDRARRILADQHHRQPRRAAGRFAEARDLRRDARAQRRGERLAVDDVSRHGPAYRAPRPSAPAGQDRPELSSDRPDGGNDDPAAG